MAYALIDNATLTAVQRLTGEVATKSTDSVDTDIVALENVVQAILFYDDLIAIDDYIPAHREARVASFPFINFLDQGSYNLDKINETASEIALTLRPKIKGGEFANDEFKSLIDLLQTHIICTWDISSSVYFLTLKGLADSNSQEFSKYGNLAAAIFSELDDVKESGGKTSSRVELVDRYGKPIEHGYKIPGAKWGSGETGGTTGAINAFVAALVWLANRSIYYSLAARYLNADTFLYPIRQAYQQHFISQRCGYGQDYTKTIVKKFSTNASSDLINIHSGGLSSATAIDLPVFSAWLAIETGDTRSIISSTLELRKNQEFIEAREQLRCIRNHLDNSDNASANKETAKIIKDFEKNSSAVKIKYGLSTRQGIPATRLIHVYNTFAALKGFPTLPDYDFKIPIPKFISNLKSQNGFCSIYRNLTDDLSTVWSLGKARDILGARVVEDRQALAYRPKSEAPIYKNSHSPFKSPM